MSDPPTVSPMISPPWSSTPWKKAGSSGRTAFGLGTAATVAWNSRSIAGTSSRPSVTVSIGSSRDATAAIRASSRARDETSAGDDFGVIQHCERRVELQLAGQRHVDDQREALQRLDGNRLRRDAVDQDLLGLVGGQLAERIVAADQAHQRIILQKLGGREAGQAEAGGDGRDLVDVGGEEGVRQVVEPLGAVLAQFAHQVAGGVGAGLAVSVHREGPLDEAEAHPGGDLAQRRDDDDRVLLGGRIEHAERLERPVGLHRPDLRLRRHHVGGPGDVAVGGGERRHHAGAHRRRHHGEDARDVGDVLARVRVGVLAVGRDGDRRAPGVDEIRLQPLDLLHEAGDPRRIEIGVAGDDLHRDAALSEIVGEAALDVGRPAIGDLVDPEGCVAPGRGLGRRQPGKRAGGQRRGPGARQQAAPREVPTGHLVPSPWRLSRS